ncbi:hypothetical protein [Nocardia sp. NPDC051981]|uniref:hypothetical protein n=1 Tax=Nocardia sp. NPDC051981 TaxID=3155417 RepID=UPI00342265B3
MLAQRNFHDRQNLHVRSHRAQPVGQHLLPSRVRPELDGCTGPGETVTIDRSTRTTVSQGVGGTVVSEWTVFGGGHTWPGAPVPEPWAGSPGSAVSLEFDAAEQIWRFAEPLLLSADARKL